jgi:hypothetical protein
VTGSLLQGHAGWSWNWTNRPAGSAELRAVLGQRPNADEQAVDLLELLPLLTPERLAAAPEPLLRTLFERFQLQVRYHKPQNRATIRVALSDLDGLLASLGDIEGGVAQQDLPVSSAGAVSLVGGAPAGIEPATPSLPWNHREPLCGPPFPQVALDRRSRSYRLS